MADEATEDVMSAADLASTYTLMRGPVRKPSMLPPDYSDQHGFNLPGQAQDHLAPQGVYNAEAALDRYGGDGDDDGPRPRSSKPDSDGDDDPNKKSSKDDDDDDD